MCLVTERGHVVITNYVFNSITIQFHSIVNLSMCNILLVDCVIDPSDVESIVWGEIKKTRLSYVLVARKLVWQLQTINSGSPCLYFGNAVDDNEHLLY